MPREYRPGQLYERKRPCDDITIGILLLSKEPHDGCWLVAEFQEYRMGAQIVRGIYDEEMLDSYEYIGSLINLKNLRQAYKLEDVVGKTG